MPHATLFLTFIVEKVGRSNTMALTDHLKFNFFLLGNQLKILESCNRCERKYLLAWITTRTGLLRKIFSIYFPLFFSHEFWVWLLICCCVPAGTSHKHLLLSTRWKLPYCFRILIYSKCPVINHLPLTGAFTTMNDSKSKTIWGCYDVFLVNVLPLEENITICMLQWRWYNV